MSFLSDLVDQLRANDHYGRLDRFSEENLLRPFLTTRQEGSDLSEACDLDAATEGRIRTFYQAVAVGIEKSTGVMTTSLIDLNHEGFGRAAIVGGRLVAVSDVMRDAGRFGFATVEKLSDRGEKLVASGAKAIANHPEVARDDD